MERITIEHKEYILRVNISDNNTCILNSYKIKRVSDMVNILTKIRSMSKETYAVKKRKLSGMVNEWRVHNLLYFFNIKRPRTRSVDLEINQPWYMKVAYAVLSIFYLHF